MNTEMNTDALAICCQQLFELAKEHKHEMKIIIEMLIEAEEDLCEDLAA